MFRSRCNITVVAALLLDKRRGHFPRLYGAPARIFWRVYAVYGAAAAEPNWMKFGTDTAPISPSKKQRRGPKNLNSPPCPSFLKCWLTKQTWYTYIWFAQNIIFITFPIVCRILFDVHFRTQSLSFLVDVQCCPESEEKAIYLTKSMYVEQRGTDEKEPKSSSPRTLLIKLHTKHVLIWSRCTRIKRSNLA